MTLTSNVVRAAALAIILLVPSRLTAMDVQQFADMTPEDQKHYLMFLLKESRALLAEQGRPDEARKVEQLFQDVPKGSDRSIGQSLFDAQLADVLGYLRANPPPLHGTIRISVESLLSQILVNNGVKLTSNFTQRLTRDARNRAFYQKPK